jgi:transcriptional regulator with XRE-family HTH domain
VTKDGLVLLVTRKIAELRREQKITQEALAEALDVPVQHVSRIEAGQNITLATLERISVALGFNVAVVFEPSKRGLKKPPLTRRQKEAKRRQK